MSKAGAVKRGAVVVSKRLISKIRFIKLNPCWKTHPIIKALS
jgi:hypothetical protein